MAESTPHRDPLNLRNWTGTVHYSRAGVPACGRLQTAAEWLQLSPATVTCARCIAMVGPDEPGHVHPEPAPEPHVARRAAERAARRAARS